METGQSRGQRSLSHLGSAGQPGTANPRAPPRAHRLTANWTLTRATAAADADRPGRSSQALEDQEVAGALLREVDVEGERHQLPSLLTKVTEMFQEKEAIQPPVCARQIPYVHRVFDLRHGVPPPRSSIGWTPPFALTAPSGAARRQSCSTRRQSPERRRWPRASRCCAA